MADCDFHHVARTGTWDGGVSFLLGQDPDHLRQLSLQMYFPGIGRLYSHSGVENVPDNTWVHLGATYDNNTGSLVILATHSEITG